MRTRYTILLFLGCLLFISSWAHADKQERLSFAGEVKLLQKYFQPVVLSSGPRKLLVLPELQGSILTSSAGDENTASFGWFSYEHLSKPHTNANAVIGGADRLWLGPQTGPFSIFFEPGSETTTENLRVPDAISLTRFDVVDQANNQIALEKQLSVTNHSGFMFSFLVKRIIRLFDSSEVMASLGMDIPAGIDYIGFGSYTKMTNSSELDWKKSTGLLSIWSISAFSPNASTTVVIPMTRPIDHATAYFTEVKSSHTLIKGKTLFYRADGNYINKIGIPPQHTKPIMGSYDVSRQLLTIVTFNISQDGNASYVNSVWDWDADPYRGEILNIFNDGLLENGKPLGPLYEMESSSAALELKPGESQDHFHNVYHFQGDEKSLSILSERLLGLDIHTIKSVFAE